MTTNKSQPGGHSSLEPRPLPQEQQQQQCERERQRRRQEQREQQYQRERKEQDYEKYMQQHCPTFDDFFDEVVQERLSEEYYYERMTPHARQEAWEQQHLNELQGVPLPRLYGGDFHPLVKYAEQQEEQLWYDQLAQAIQIDNMVTWDPIKPGEEKNIQEHKRNIQLLIQKEQWEHNELLDQQQLQ